VDCILLLSYQAFELSLWSKYLLPKPMPGIVVNDIA